MMGYTVHLFALDADTFGQRLRNQLREVLERTRVGLRREGELGANDFIRAGPRGGDLSRGYPPICSENHFWALCWWRTRNWSESH